MKKLISFWKKYQLIIGLALLAGLVISYKILFPEPEKQEQALPTPSPYPIRATIPPSAAGQGITEEKFVENLLNQFPLTPYLPYPGKELAIKYTAPLALEIKIKEATSAAIREKALDWIRDQGIDPQTHEIIWK